MSDLYIFRGKAATGKTLLSNLLSKNLKICVLRKDDIFDPLSPYIDNSINNNICYDVLASLVQNNIKNGVDIILDIALAHSEYYKLFLSKLDLKDTKVLSFLCDCSDEAVWLARWDERLKNPSPNQYFTSNEEIKNHYAKMDISLFQNEYLLDSVKTKEQLLNEVFSVINSEKQI